MLLKHFRSDELGEGVEVYCVRRILERIYLLRVVTFLRESVCWDGLTSHEDVCWIQMFLLVVHLSLLIHLLPFLLAWGVDAACGKVSVICLVQLDWVHLTSVLADGAVKGGVVMDVAPYCTFFICRVKHLNLIINVGVLTCKLLALTCSHGYETSVKVLWRWYVWGYLTLMAFNLL